MVSFGSWNVNLCNLSSWVEGMCFLFQAEKDVVECLQKALSRRGLDMNVAALVSTLVFLNFLIVCILF